VNRWRYLLVIPVLAVAVALVIWRGPDWHLVHDAFTAVTWPWVAAAIGLNLLSVLARAFAWDTAIKQSIAPPHPSFPTVFSAFSVGLFANAVLPGASVSSHGLSRSEGGSPSGPEPAPPRRSSARSSRIACSTCFLR